jgi:hypothetical protein
LPLRDQQQVGPQCELSLSYLLIVREDLSPLLKLMPRYNPLNHQQSVPQDGEQI